MIPFKAQGSYQLHWNFHHLSVKQFKFQWTQEERSLKTEQSSDVSLPVVGSSTVKFLESNFFANDLLHNTCFLLNFEVDQVTRNILKCQRKSWKFYIHNTYIADSVKIEFVWSRFLAWNIWWLKHFSALLWRPYSRPPPTKKNNKKQLQTLHNVEQHYHDASLIIWELTILYPQVTDSILIVKAYISHHFCPWKPQNGIFPNCILKKCNFEASIGRNGEKCVFTINIVSVICGLPHCNI